VKLATLNDGPDGSLIVVSRDLTRGVRASAAATMQAALDDWSRVEPLLRDQAASLEAEGAEGTFALEMGDLAAAMPRSFQFLDASAFLAHNHILARAWGFEPRGESEPPLMYQGISFRYIAPRAPVQFADFSHDVDFEAEFGVITDAVPMGISPDKALQHARLIVVINDWSLRAFGPEEMRGGFGFLHAKPPSTLSSVAVTPDELGAAWANGRVGLALNVALNGSVFGRPVGSAMHFGFGELIAHAARTRDLCAGTVLGSGTVSNYDAEAVGSGCIAERRALDAVAGRAATPYLKPGDKVELWVDGLDGPIFDRLAQTIEATPLND
jgi:fumarylacetoacetate (FAA) hydrolase